MCLPALDIPFMKSRKLINSFITFKTNIFPAGIRPTVATNPIKEPMFIVAPHYPNQAYRQINVGQTKWTHRGVSSQKSYIMEFNLRNVEILQKRDRHREPCLGGVPDYDEHIKLWILKKVGCKPPYWSSTSKLSLCTTFDEMKLLSKLLGMTGSSPR